MKYLLVLILMLSFVGGVSSQKHDNIWHLGYDWNEFTNYIEGNLVNFDQDGIHVEEFNESPVDFWCSNYTFCDSIGQMVYSTNGAVIVDKKNKIVPNSEVVNDTLNWDLNFGNYTFNGHYGIQFEANKYLFIYSIEAGFRPLEMHIMELSPDGESLKVNYKDKLIVKDTFLFGNFQLCKHANGRDWWLVCPKADSNVFFTTLITPDTIYPPIVQAIGELRNGYDGFGQSKFSPDGSHYVFSSFICGLSLYDFNRTTGVFSNPSEYTFEVNHPFLEGARSSGLEFSPNNKFLYFANYIDMWQLDLTKAQENIFPLLIGSWDGFIDSTIQDMPTESLFFHAQLAPDGKIYWATLPATTYLHVIEYPNSKGTACFLNQHSIKLPNYNCFNMSTSPNYRLGPLDGSPADTLGLDNIPVANFRADQDTLNFLDFQFQDLSYYEPTTWSWDFGDGTMSSDTSPVHTYAKQGVYVVCLTVSNINGISTICDTLILGTTLTKGNATTQKEMLVFPNPASDQVNFIMNDYYPIKAFLNLYDLNGKKLFNTQVYQGWNDMNVSELAAGIYFYEVLDQGVRRYSGKLMVE